MDNLKCTECSSGKYCENEGSASITGVCDAGTWCKSGSPWKSASLGVSPAALQTCPTGSFCPEEGAVSDSQRCICTTCAINVPVFSAILQEAPTACGLGTFQEEFGSISCKSCLPGVVCGSYGLKTKFGSGLCAGGFYCIGGAVSDRPIDGITGDLCPKGHYCPAGMYLNYFYWK